MSQTQTNRLQEPASSINVGQKERILSLAGGAALTALALARRGSATIPAVIGGVALLAQGLTGNSPIYRALGINTAVRTQPRRVSVPHKQGIHVARAVTINRPADVLYNFWREPSNLPQIIDYIESVQMTGENRAHWTIRLPGGMKAEFDVEVYTDVPNEVISWRSLPDSQIQNAGSVRFRPAPAGRGTQVELTIEFVPPGGPLGQAVMKLFGDMPEQYIGQYLREFKQIMETGEKATTEGQTSGRSGEIGQ
ncbi:MAG: SRPBCC family protein [Chloroflexota bacterium]